MSYKKKASANRDALFGGVAESSGPSSSRTKKTKAAAAPPPARRPAAAPPAAVPNSLGYTPQTTKRNVKPSLTGEARTVKLQEAEDYKRKAKKAMQSSLFSKGDPVAASTFYKRAADAYQLIGTDCATEERFMRLSSADCNLQIGAHASVAADFTRAAQLLLESDSSEQAGRDASGYYKQASTAFLEMGEKAKAAAMTVKAAMALQHGDDSSAVLSKQVLEGLEEAVEAHVPDVFNPYARYRQTGVSAFINPDSEETVEHPSPETLALAESHLVSRAYAHEPLQELTQMLSSYHEYASALYAAGAATKLLQQEGLSALTLSRAYVVETILLLAMGDPIAAEQGFLNVHVQHTAYLTSRECQLAEELIKACKTRDPDALEEARAPSGPNRAALANLPPSIRKLVGDLRLSGVAKSSNNNHRNQATADTTTPAAKKPETSLQDILNAKTGYEKEVEAGAALDGDALQDELDGLNFDDDDDDNDFGVDPDLDDLEDDDIDLR